MHKVLLLVFLLFSISASAGWSSKDYWVCDQAGKIGDDPLWVSSGVFGSENQDNETRETLFEQAVSERTNNNFVPEFDGTCQGFQNKKVADRFLKKKMSRAEKRRFHILWVDFDY